MGSLIELNDTLQINAKQGFPEKLLKVKENEKGLVSLKSLKGRVFAFKGKTGARIFHIAPTPVFLVQNIEGKWLYWGRAQISEQTILWNGRQYVTSGKYRITKIYDYDYQMRITKNESPKGKSYF